MARWFVIHGKMQGLNEMVLASRGNKYAANKTKQVTDDMIVWEIKKQISDYKAVKIVDIDFKWFELNRRRDKDNVCSAKKFIMDALVKAGTIKGDGWKYVGNFTDTFAVGEEACVLVVLKERG